MRVRCTATADYRCNAVGDLELECTAEGLCIALCGVSSYREGYAPGPPVHASAVCVPWPAVYATRIGERQLQLSVDARNLPLNRFLLADFAERPPDAEDSGPARLPYVLAGAAFVALGLGLWAARALPFARAAGTLGWAALAVLVVLSVIAWRGRAAPRTPAYVVLDELCHELSRHVPHQVSAAAPMPAPRSLEPATLSSLLPRSVVAIAITLAATTLAALIGSSAARPKVGRDEARAGGDLSDSVAAPLGAVQTPSASAEPAGGAEPRRASVTDAWQAPATGAAWGAPASSGASSGESACACSRHESLAWQTPLARLSTVVISQSTRVHEGHAHTELELGLVNDGRSDARQLSVSVLFFEQRAGEHAGHFQTGERPSFFAGPLEPGSVIRWHVEGRGTSFDVIAPDLGTLANDGSDAAPAEAYARLASGGDRALRLHATRMLAFLGDDRAESSRRALEPSAAPAESEYLARLLEAPRDVAACALAVDRASTPWRVEACLYNRTDQILTGVGVRLLAFDGALDPVRPGAKAPTLLGEHTTRVAATLAPRSGRRVDLAAPVSIAAGKTPRAFELETLRSEVQP